MGMESVYKLSVILNMVDQLTAPMGRESQNLGSRLSGLQSGFGMALSLIHISEPTRPY